MKNIRQIIESKFGEDNNTAAIPLMHKNLFFTATKNDKGIEVDNLANQSLLPWSIFDEVVGLLKENDGSAIKGNAMQSKLGSEKLPLNSVEGRIASAIYDKQEGETVFRRISPVGAILVWAGICEHGKASLILKLPF